MTIADIDRQIEANRIKWAVIDLMEAYREARDIAFKAWDDMMMDGRGYVKEDTERMLSILMFLRERFADEIMLVMRSE